MKITTTLAAALGLCTLAACSGGAEENTANTDINMEMPAENLDMMAGNDMNAMDANMMNNMDMNAANTTDAANATDANATGNNTL